MKNIKYILPVLLIGFLVSCNKQSEVMAQEPIATTSSNNMMMTGTAGELQVGDKLLNDEVCMVNNAYMGGAKQMEVKHDGKIYYGCCAGCVGTIQNDASARVAIDPYSGKEVDKAEAYIVLAERNGNVNYFENEANFKASNKK